MGERSALTSAGIVALYRNTGRHNHLWRVLVITSLQCSAQLFLTTDKSR